MIYNTVSNQECANLSLGDELQHSSLAFNLFGSLVAVGREDGAKPLIYIDNMEVVTTLNGHHGAVDHLVFSPDGKLFFSAGADSVYKQAEEAGEAAEKVGAVHSSW